VDQVPNDPRPWPSAGSWTIEANDAALARIPPFGERFLAQLFRELPVLAEGAIFLRWSEQPDDVYVFFDWPECAFSVQVDAALEYLVVAGPGGTAEYGDWNGDQVPPALSHMREIVSQLDI